MAKEEAKPITSDPDEQELLKSMDIPLTDPAAKAEDEPTPAAEPEKVDPPAEETPAKVEGEESTETPAETPADPPAEPAAAAPVEPETPAKPAESVAQPTRQPIQIQPDAILNQLDSAIEKVKTSDILEEWEKDAKLAELMVKREEHVDRLTQRQTSAIDQAWGQAEKVYGLPRAQLEPLTNQVRQELWNRGYRGDALEGAGAIMLEQRAALERAKAPAIPAAAKPTPAKPAPASAPTPITAAGARIAPPSATAVPAKPRPKTDEEELVEFQRKHVPGGIRALVR